MVKINIFILSSGYHQSRRLFWFRYTHIQFWKVIYKAHKIHNFLWRFLTGSSIIFQGINGHLTGWNLWGSGGKGFGTYFYLDWLLSHILVLCFIYIHVYIYLSINIYLCWKKAETEISILLCQYRGALCARWHLHMVKCRMGCFTQKLKKTKKVKRRSV